MDVYERKFDDAPIDNPTECARCLWEALGDCSVTMESNGTFLNESFLHFPEGTEVERIWHWFEQTLGVSVATDLMKTG